MLLRRNFSSINNIMKTSAMNVFEKSCYHKIDFKINEDSPVKEAVQRFNAFNIGCLAVTNNSNRVVGVCSERDYISKVAALDKNMKEVKVKDICTYSPIIIATKDDSLESCMNKMMFKDIRHLLILDDKKDEFVGMISIKDLIKEIMKKNDDMITRLSDFKIGKGAFFGSE
jgi:predicted transcriptional regulator